MRVLHLTSHMNVGGITTTVLNLSEALAARDHQVSVASGDGELANRLTSQGIAHWSYPSLDTSAEFSPTVWRAGSRLAARLRTEPVDVMHAHTRVAQVVAERIMRRTRIPYVTTWHGFYRARLCRRLHPCTGVRTIAISEPVADHLRDCFHVPAERIRVVPHGVDVASFSEAIDDTVMTELRERLKIPRGHAIVGTAARLVPDKGVDHLLDAFAQVVARRPRTHLVIVGEGRNRARLTKIAQEPGLAGSVAFAGSLPDLRVALGLMDIFVFLPAVREGFGLSLLEAMASAKPIVAIGRGGGSSWLLEQSQAAVVVQPGDPEDLAEEILKLLDDSEAARQLGMRAQMIARTRYSLDRMVDQVEAVYAEAIEMLRVA